MFLGKFLSQLLALLQLLQAIILLALRPGGLLRRLGDGSQLTRTILKELYKRLEDIDLLLALLQLDCPLRLRIERQGVMSTDLSSFGSLTFLL